MSDTIEFHAGDMITNRVTGERIVFRETSRENGGRRVVFDTYVEPEGFVAAPHVHPNQEERFQVISGQLEVELGDKKVRLGPGEAVTVPRGTGHHFWNAGEQDVHFRAEIRPALQFERLLATMFGLAQDGKTNRKGLPNPLRLAVIAQAHFDTVQLPFPPVFVQRVGLSLAAPLGRLVGWRPTYEPENRDYGTAA